MEVCSFWLGKEGPYLREELDKERLVLKVQLMEVYQFCRGKWFKNSKKKKAERIKTGLLVRVVCLSGGQWVSALLGPHGQAIIILSLSLFLFISQCAGSLVICCLTIDAFIPQRQIIDAVVLNFKQPCVSVMKLPLEHVASLIKLHVT